MLSLVVAGREGGGARAGGFESGGRTAAGERGSRAARLRPLHSRKRWAAGPEAMGGGGAAHLAGEEVVRGVLAGGDEPRPLLGLAARRGGAQPAALDGVGGLKREGGAPEGGHGGGVCATAGFGRRAMI